MRRTPSLEIFWPLAGLSRAPRKWIIFRLSGVFVGEAAPAGTQHVQQVRRDRQADRAPSRLGRIDAGSNDNGQDREDDPGIAG